jgi:chromosome partitioning protein
VLSPIQLNQEAMDGVAALLNHDRAGVRKIRALLNPKLNLVGLLPTMVEATPFKKANFAQVIQKYRALLIPVGTGPGEFACIPRRSAIAEAQADGRVLWEMKKTAARDAWREIEPGINRIAAIVGDGADKRAGVDIDCCATTVGVSAIADVAAGAGAGAGVGVAIGSNTMSQRQPASDHAAAT